MKLGSTRNSSKKVSFYEAITNCIPEDGGLYVPDENMDLTQWISCLTENSSFASIAGSLTSAMLREEFSPAVSERIATAAFENYSPRLKQLDESSICFTGLQAATEISDSYGLPPYWNIFLPSKTGMQ